MKGYNIERQNEVPGTPPTSLWTAFQVGEDGETLVVMVGLAATVEGMTRQLRRLGKRQISLPVASVVARNRAGKVVELAVLVVGRWSNFSDAKAVVTEIAGGAGDGYKQWDPRLRELADEQPERLLPEDFSVGQEIVYALCDAYLDECRRAVAS